MAEFNHAKELNTNVDYDFITDAMTGDRDARMHLYFQLLHSFQKADRRDGCALALSEKLQDVIDNPVFVDQMRDVIRYRTMDYYQRRYIINWEKE